MNIATKRIIWKLREDEKLWKLKIFYSSLDDFKKLPKKTHVLR